MSLTSSRTPADFDEAFQRMLRGPEGADLRRAHLMEQLTTRLCEGDPHRAQILFDADWEALGGRSPAEAAQTHEGMLEVKRVIEERAPKKPSATRGVGAFLEAVEETRRCQFEPLLDLLPAAWGMSDPKFEVLLGTPPPIASEWRRGAVVLTPEICARLARLRRLHEAFRLMEDREHYAEIWRRIQGPNSPLGDRSLWRAYLEDGDAALDIAEAHYRDMASIS